MLTLIGLGLTEGDLTIRGMDEITRADEVYIENYTSFPYEVNFQVIRLSREQVESDFLISKALTKNVVLLVAGDPLFATTHTALIFEARKKGVAVKVIHAPSIINAILRTGISPYKFGRIVTLSKTYDSDREKIKKNLSIGLHTLCLINPQTPIKRALQILKKMGFSGKFIVGERLGQPSEKLWFDSLENLLGVSFGEPPYSIIIPSNLHFFEDDFILQAVALHK